MFDICRILFELSRYMFFQVQVSSQTKTASFFSVIFIIYNVLNTYIENTSQRANQIISIKLF